MAVSPARMDRRWPDCDNPGMAPTYAATAAPLGKLEKSPNVATSRAEVCGPMPGDRGQQPADLVRLQQPLDVPLERAQPTPQHVQILTRVADLDPIDLGMVLPHRPGGRIAQLGGQRVAHAVAAVIAEPRHAPRGHPAERRRRGVRVQNRRGQLAPQIPHMVRKLREAQVNEPMQLPHPIAEVLDESIAKAHQFPQFLDRRIG